MTVGADRRLLRQLIRGFLGVGGLKSVAIAGGLLLSLLLARWLGADGYGQYAFVLAVLNLLAMPVSAGLPELLMREVARYEQRGAWGLLRGLWLRANQWVLLAGGVIAALIVVTCFPRAEWAADDRWTLFLIGALVVPALGLNALRVAALQGLRKVVLAQLPPAVLRPLGQVVIVTGLYLCGVLNPLSALGGFAVAVLLALALGVVLLGRVRPDAATQAMPRFTHRRWLAAWLPFTLLAAVTVVNKQVNLVLLGTMSVASEVAMLRLAENLAQLAMLPMTIVNAVLAPQVSRLAHAGNRQALQKLMQQASRLTLIVALPIAACLVILGRTVLAAVFGSEYAPAYIPMLLITLGQLINLGLGSVGLVLSMGGYERDTLMGLVIGVLINIALAGLLIPSHGAVGAAAAMAASLGTWNLVLTARLWKRMRIRTTAI